MAENTSARKSGKDGNGFADSLKYKAVKVLAAAEILAAAFAGGHKLMQEQPEAQATHIETVEGAHTLHSETDGEEADIIFFGKIENDGTVLQEQDETEYTTAYVMTADGKEFCSYRTVPMSPSDSVEMQNLVNGVAKSDAGREVLKAISEYGTVLAFDTLGSDTYGCFCSSKNAISLNPIYADDVLSSTLVHECKHAMQRQAMSAQDADYTYSSMVMINRAMEADAKATQTKFCFEMAAQGDSAALQSMEEDHPDIVSAYAQASAKYGENSNQTMKETMLSWYKDVDYVTSYDEDFADFYEQCATNNSSDQMREDGLFSKTMNADELIESVCSWKGDSYAGTDGSILKTPETFYTREDIYNRVSKTSSFISEKTSGARTDASMNDFYVCKDDSISEMTYQMQVSQIALSDVMSAVMGRQIQRGNQEKAAPTALSEVMVAVTGQQIQQSGRRQSGHSPMSGVMIARTNQLAAEERRGRNAVADRIKAKNGERT